MDRDAEGVLFHIGDTLSARNTFSDRDERLCRRADMVVKRDGDACHVPGELLGKRRCDVVFLQPEPQNQAARRDLPEGPHGVCFEQRLRRMPKPFLPQFCHIVEVRHARVDARGT